MQGRARGDARMSARRGAGAAHAVVVARQVEGSLSVRKRNCPTALRDGKDKISCFNQNVEDETER
jgi:hypothetical protein